MGTDNLHHKRKPKSVDESRRRKPVRASYDKVLIVCEGSKAEPLYFQELVDHYEIHSANVRISGDCGSDPVSVVKHGIQLYQAEKQSASGPFDRVYCVFDRDAHANYRQANEIVGGVKPKGVFFATPSVPCFEYWLLLHFDYTTAPFSAVGGTSSCAAALEKLNSDWPEYAKGRAGTFLHTLNLRNDELGYAKANAGRALRAAGENHTDNPSTHVHELVDYLQGIKKHPPQ